MDAYFRKRVYRPFLVLFARLVCARPSVFRLRLRLPSPVSVSGPTRHTAGIERPDAPPFAQANFPGPPPPSFIYLLLAAPSRALLEPLILARTTRRHTRHRRRLGRGRLGRRRPLFLARRRRLDRRRLDLGLSAIGHLPSAVGHLCLDPRRMTTRPGKQRSRPSPLGLGQIPHPHSQW